jgi:excinuclease ABC subunit C
MLAKPQGIPRASGCYLFRNEAGTIIYVGKAKVLVQRLSSYFQSERGLTHKTQSLMKEAASVEWIIAPSELDALILENELIKENQPRFNMRLKDDKSYPYVAIDTRAPFPAPYTTRTAHVKGVRYFGPFVDVRALRVTMDELLRAFPLRSCSKHKFNYHQRIVRPCLLFDIGKCSGPCAGLIDEAGYQELVDSWARFFDGDIKPLQKILQHQMETAASKKHYEAAALARDSLAALARAQSSQSIVLDDHSNIDVISIASDRGRAAIVRFLVRHGRIIGRTVHLVDRSMDEPNSEILEAAITDMYQDTGSVPPTLVVADESTVSAVTTEYLVSQRGHSVEIAVAKKGRRRRVIDMAEHDALSVIARDSLRRQADHNVRSRSLQELGTALSIEPPYRIECFDMSHLQGTNYVGSMVVFEDGLPIKKEYRHFNVKEVPGNNDVAAMEEVVRRRLAHWQERQATTKFRHPDLVIIDGGLPQLHAAEKAAETLGLLGLVEFTALAKREELLYRPGSSDPIALERGSESLYLVQRIRDEAHRFAITFHRSKRGKSMVASTLEGISGLGPSRRARLLEAFGSLDDLRAAGIDDLLALSWLPDNVAARVHSQLHDTATTPMSPLISSTGVTSQGATITFSASRQHLPEH